MRYLSLFDGIGAASVAWEPLGWECVGVSEIDRFPIAVTSHHRPSVPHLGDVTKITESQVSAIGHIDLIVGGFPCQDLSVAGKRAGLRNEDGSTTRSGLFFDAMRIVQWARKHCGLRYLLIENVPGLYSSNKGRDFAAVVGAMVGTEFDVPGDGWRNAGFAVGPEGMCEWATLDAQFFNVAQRRVRVFALADFGDWSGRPPILLEPDSVRGDSAPSREAREGAAPIIGGGPDGGRIAGTVSSKWAKGSDGPAGDECYNIVAHSLRGEGFDASEDGTGRGTPLIPVAFAQNQRDEVRLMDVDGALSAEPGMKQQTYVTAIRTANTSANGHGIAEEVAHTLDQAQGQAIAFSAKDYGADAGDIAPTLRSMGHDGSHANGGGQVAVAFMADDYKDGSYEACDTARPLTTSADRTRAAPIAVAFESRFVRNGRGAPSDVVPPLKAQTGKGDAAPLLATAIQVRRLTPIECERLQGFPDGYTAIPWRGKPAAQCPDGPRYKALGNSFAVPVVRWIGSQIERASAWRA